MLCNSLLSFLYLFYLVILYFIYTITVFVHVYCVFDTQFYYVNMYDYDLIYKYSLKSSFHLICVYYIYVDIRR